MKSVSNADGPLSILANRIRFARRTARLSQSELADSMKVASSAVAQWESTNGTTPRIEKFPALAAAVGVSVDWLLTGRGDRRRQRSFDEAAPAVTTESFAHDIDEELVLKQFRRLQPRARELFLGLLTELGARRSRGREPWTESASKAARAREDFDSFEVEVPG